MQENQRLNLAFMDHLEDMMAATAGVPRLTRRIQVPSPPTYIKHATMNTTNNIRVEAGSQVGQINAGALVYLDRAVSVFNSQGNPALARALKDFTQAVVDSNALSAESQRQVLELLQVLVEQTTKSKEQRNTSIAKLAFQSIGSIVSAANLLATHWEALKHFFQHLVG